MKRSFVFLTLLATAGFSTAEEKKVDFVRDVKPILEGTCIHCHGPDKDEGDVRLDTKKAAFESNGDNPGVTPGDPDDSSVWWTTVEPAESDIVMPPKKQLSKSQTDILKIWIEEGADWPEGLVLKEEPRMDFKNNIQPLFARGGPFNESERRLIRLWSDQGAIWPEGLKLGGPEEEGPKDDLDLVKQIRAKIIEKEEANPVASESEMKEYEDTITATGVKFAMVPIKGGEFMMGSPDSEPDREDVEGPQRKVQVDPFWMGKFEVTWDEYEPFMITETSRRKDGSPDKVPADSPTEFIVSKPTTPYQEMSFGMGVKGFPAICMTQHAAQKYCEWISAQTGHFYRLPTEAEWEYACRAGTTTAFSWGDDPSKMDDYGWHYKNAGRKYHKVGEKLPNPWGLHDMHGNVLEWVMDAYLPGLYPNQKGDLLKNPFVKPGKDLYPRVAKGGSWFDDPEYCRSASRYGSEPDWKIQDPQLPKSIWYHTDAEWLGFRVVRPLKTPPTTKMLEIWNVGKGEENDYKPE